MRIVAPPTARRRRLAVVAASLLATSAALATVSIPASAFSLWVNRCFVTSGNAPDDAACLGGAGFSPNSPFVPQLVINPTCGDLVDISPNASTSCTDSLSVAYPNGTSTTADVSIVYDAASDGTNAPPNDLPKVAICTNPTGSQTMCEPTGAVPASGGQFGIQVATDAQITTGDYEFTITAESPTMQPTIAYLDVRVLLPGQGANGSNCNGCQMSNHSNGYMTQPTVHVLYWGSAWGGDALNIHGAVDGTMAQEVAGAWQGIMGQYGVSNSAWGGSFVDTQNDAGMGSSITAAEIATELERVRQLTGWGNDINTMWIVMAPPNEPVANTVADGTSRACAWHTYTTYQGFQGNTLVQDSFSAAAIPYFGTGAYQSSCQYTPGPVGSVLQAVTHEYSEGLTDINGNGWYYSSASTGEIGDLCNFRSIGRSDGTYSGGSNYRGGAQMLYSNGAVDCTSTATGGYYLVAKDGGVFTFGDAVFAGSMGNTKLNAPMVGIATMPGNNGYWTVASDGGVFTFGSALFYGSEGATRLVSPVVGMASTPDGGGYWLVAADGGVFTFGDAKFFGSIGGRQRAYPIVAMARTSDGLGYWLVDSIGEVYNFGDALYEGQYGNATVIGLSPSPTDDGYCIATDQLWVNYQGTCAFEGDMGGQHLNASAVGFVSTIGGHGYYGVGSDGGVFTFGDAHFFGSEGNVKLNAPMVGMAVTP